MPILGVVLFRLADLFDFFRFLELLLGRFGQFGRPRLDKLHGVIGHFGRGFGRTGGNVLGRTNEILHLFLIPSGIKKKKDEHSSSTYLIKLDLTVWKFTCRPPLALQVE